MKVKTIAKDIDDFIYNLDERTQAKVLRTVGLLETYGYRLCMPVSKSLHEGLFELRITGSDQVRILYCFHQDTAYLLTAFKKKTARLSKRELDLARARRQMLA